MQLVLVTEPIILSLANVLREYDGLPAAVSMHHRDLKMSELERKHGLLQVVSAVGPCIPWNTTTRQSLCQVVKKHHVAMLCVAGCWLAEHSGSSWVLARGRSLGRAHADFRHAAVPARGGEPRALRAVS